MIPAVLLIAILLIILIRFEPAIDVTVDKKVLLWYTNKSKERVYKHLFNI